MRPKQNETEFVGEWVMEDGRVVPNAAAQRIEALIEEGVLEKVGRSADGWQQLFRDPTDGRLWELVYPEGSSQGGGPPTLRVIAEDAAARQYQGEF